MSHATESPRYGDASRLRTIIPRVYREMDRHNAFNGAAALGFYFTLAIFPATVFVVATIPYLPVPRVDQAIMDFLRQALPDQAANMFTDVVRQVTRERRGGLLSIGIVTALWAASTGMYATMRQLNIVLNVAERRTFLRGRMTALLLTLLSGGLVVGAFSLVVLGGVVQDWLGRYFGFGPLLLGFFVIFRWVVIVLALLFALAFVYHFAPNRRKPFDIFTLGHVTATVMLVAASMGFSFFTSHFGRYSVVYGSIGAVVVLMVSLYVTGLIVLIGAEIDAVRSP